MARIRIDRLLVERGLVESRERAQALILAGRVFLQGQRIDKAGTAVPETAEPEVKGNVCPYVSRGGLKLAGVLDPLGVDPSNRICIDVGASTGGFTDVLLQHGALRVHAVDVGRGLLHQRLRTDARVVVHEGVNARFPLQELVGEMASLIVADVSFISLTKVLPAMVPVLGPISDAEASIVAMVKPQFELGPKLVGKGGVVRDDALRAQAVQIVVESALALGLRVRAQEESPLPGPAGNREIFVRFTR